MEGTAVVEEHNLSQQTCHVPKSARSLIRIDSISIDLVNARDTTDVGKCEHFTIRGYVSEMRKKNWKTGWPFALAGTNEKIVDCFHPPISVPKARWWRCRNCVLEVCTAKKGGGSENHVQEEGTTRSNVNSQPGENEKQDEIITQAANKGDENNHSEVDRTREIAAAAAHLTEMVNCNNESAAEAGTRAFEEHSSGNTSLQADEINESTVKSGSFRDKSASSSRKKSRKVRLMTELLAKDGIPSTDVNSLHIDDEGSFGSERSAGVGLQMISKEVLTEDRSERGAVVARKRLKKKNKAVFESSSEEAIQDNVAKVDIALTDKGNSPLTIPGLKIDQNLVKKKNIRVQDGNPAPLQPVQQKAFTETMQRYRDSGPQFTGGPGVSESGHKRKYSSFTSCTYGNNHQGELSAFFQRSELPFIKASQVEGVRPDSGGPSNRQTENDDVMEIAELMAKNQFERCLPDAENDKQPANKNTQRQLVDLNEEYVVGQEDNVHRLKNGENMGNKEKTVDYLSSIDTKSFKVSHLDQKTFTSSGLMRPVCQYPETLSKVHCFPSNVNSQWMGNILTGPTSSHYGLQSTRAYSNIPEGTSQQPGAINRHFPTMYPNHLPFMYNSVMNKGNYDGNRNLNFRNPSGSSFENRKNTDSEAIGKQQVGGYSSVCKFSGATFDASGPPRLFQRPSFPYQNPVVPPTIPHNFSNDRFPTVDGFAVPKSHNFFNQVSMESRGKGKAKAKDSRGSSSLQNPVLFTQHFSAAGNANKQNVGAPSSSNATTVQPLKSSVVCTINRSPSDFTTPGAGNEYMIAGEELKVRKLVASENRAGPSRLDGPKRQKKTAGPKEAGRRKMP